MQSIKTIYAVDSHTMGEPTRIVIGGVPEVPGNSMIEKKQYLEEHMDYLRTSMMYEPRGHKDMFGSIIMEPTTKDADLGVIFMDGGGYLNMCGHGSIGAATVAVDKKLVKVTEPFTNIVLEAPAGLIKAKVKVENGKAKEVSIVNVPAFLYKKDIEIDVYDVGRVILDIAFGGSFFAIVKGRDLGIHIKPSECDKIVELGMKVIKSVNEQVEIKHPMLPHIKTVDLCEIYGPPESQDATLKNVVVFGKGQLDRSPCGTGTSAKLAALYAKGELNINESFIYESILCTKFKGKIVGKTKVGNYDAVIPEITGSAFITAYNQFLIDPEDPVKYGFTLS